MDTVYTKREDAGKALLGLLGMAMNRTEPVSIGRYKGFDLQIAYFAMDKMYLAYLVGSGINPVQLSANVVGNIMRLDNCLHNLPQSVTDLESKLVQLQKQLENAKEQLAQPFAQADELAEKSKRLAELEALLNLNEKDIVLDFLYSSWKRFRKYNAYATGISQDIQDYLDNPVAYALLSNSEFVIMLRQSKSLEALERLYGLSKPQLEFLRNASEGHGIIKMGNSMIPFSNLEPKDTAVYKLITTKPGEATAEK
jgi:hypothetical protein